MFNDIFQYPSPRLAETLTAANDDYTAGFKKGVIHI
jgi:hypothetical protein